jgi:chromosome segregation ATPase
MKSVTETRQETAEVLSNAVAELARRAIQPEIEPFKHSIALLVGNLEGHAETFGEQVQTEKKALDGINKQLLEVIATCKSQVAATDDMHAKGQEIREHIDILAGELAATRDEQATAVAALNSLRDEVTGWMQASNEQTERLEICLARAETLNEMLSNQHSALSSFSYALSNWGNACARKVLRGIKEGRSDMTSLGVAHQARHDAAMGDVRTHIEALRSEIDGKVERGFSQVVGSVSDSREYHARELAKTGQTAERIFRLAVANLILVLVALAIGGVVLWKAAR